MADGIRIEGMRDLRRELAKVGDDMPARLKVVAKLAADEVAGTARTLAPRRSGALIGTIRTGVTQRSATVKAGGRRAPYAPPIHFGWHRRHIAPQPFLYRALDRQRDEVIEKFTKALQQLIDDTFPGG